MLRALAVETCRGVLCLACMTPWLTATPARAQPQPQPRGSTAPAPAPALPMVLPGAVAPPLSTPEPATAAAPGSGQRAFALQPAIDAQITATSNGNYGRTGPQRSDTILSITPRLGVNVRGARNTIDGEFGFESLTYTSNTQKDRVLPRGNLRWRSNLIDRWLLLDAGVLADRTPVDPFAGNPGGALSANDYSLVRYRIAPTLDHQFTPSLSLQARSEHAWTKRSGGPNPDDPLRDTYVEQQLVKLEQQPLPLGYSLEYDRQDTQYTSATGSVLTLQTLRAVGSYAATPDLILGAVVGHENSRFSLSDRSESLYGVRVRWNPSARTQFAVALEDRFFGTGWDIEWRHRAPFFAFNVRLLRQPTTQPASQVLGAPGATVSSLLDAMLTTRVPDAAQRGAMVADLVDRLGLPASLSSPVELFSDYAQLQQGGSASIMFMGRLTTVAVTVYQRKFQRLRVAGDPLSDPALSTSDNRQSGIEVEFNRRLTPRLVATAGLRWARIEGLAARAGDESREKLLRAGITYALSPDTSMTLGLRRQLLDSNVRDPGQETGVLVGIGHRF